MPVTIKDVAERVGRSITTVSRALNDYDDVSEETRELVKKTAKEMGYIPSSIAQRLQKQRADAVGFILPTFGPRFSDPFFSEFVAGIGSTITRLGYDLLVSACAPGQDEETEIYLRKMRSRRVDGFIIVRTRRNDSRIALLLEHNYPFVVFGRTEQDNDFPLVDEDGGVGMRMVVDHLVERGHQRIAFIAAPADLMFAHYRLQGFLAAMEAHSLPVDPSLIVEGALTQKSGREMTEKLLNLSNPPTAIAACNDLMAIGAMSTIQAHGLRVGKDIAVTGFDDTPWAAQVHPRLTTVHQPIYQIGAQVTEMLISLIRGEKLEEPQVILQPSFIVRESSG